MSARRWVCPDCGTGLLAPERPRSDDVRRYCLPCSKRTGRLVRRSCPALERERAEAAEKRVAARVAKLHRDQERARAARTHAGVELLAEAARLWKLPAMRELGRAAGRRPLPELMVRRRTSGYSGRAWPHRIVVSLGPDVDAATALMVLLHELAHAAGSGDAHGPKWRTRYMAAAREAWPTGRFAFHEADQADRYGLDRLVRDGIRTTLGEAS